MIEMRRYERGDIPVMINILRDALKDTHYGGIRFEPDKLDVLLSGNVKNKSFYCNVLVSSGQVVGGMAGEVLAYPFSYEAYAVDRVTYILPEHRGLDGITRLVRAYIAWAKDRRVREIRWSQSSGFKIDKFPILAKRLGFTQIGSHFNMEVFQ